MVEHLSDEQMKSCGSEARPDQMYAAYKAAVEHTGSPM